MATDEVLGARTADEILAADVDQLWAWSSEGLGTATTRSFDFDESVLAQTVYVAADRIRKGECPTYEL
ncbi:MAG: hypothetical protein ACREGB_01525 [Candidatus Saccharimonadales bacterium]